MANNKIISFRVNRVKGKPYLRWAEGMSFRMPASILHETKLAEHIDKNGNMEINKPLPPIDSAIIQKLLMLAAFTDQKPLSARLPISYQMIPPKIRSLTADFIGRVKRRELNRTDVFPAWPLDLSTDFLSDLTQEMPSPFAASPTPVLLTHDLDSAEGLDNLVKHFLDIEENVGARSTNFIVPSGWPIDHKQVELLVGRGHELGVHGYDHSNKTPFCSAEERRARIKRNEHFISRYKIEGFRSPSLLRTRQFLRDLGELFRYDSSIPSSGGLFPAPWNGCASARPFSVEGIVELPLSLPRDGSLRFIGHSPKQILDIWIMCSEKIARSGGVVVLLTHCEKRFSGNKEMLAVYREFIHYIAASEIYEWSNPKEVIERSSL